MSFRNPSQFNLNQMNSNQSNFNQSYLPIQNIIPQRDIKNHNNVFHNNINDPIVSEIVTEYTLHIDSADRNTSVYPNPYKFSVSLGGAGQQTIKTNTYSGVPNPRIDIEFKNIKYVKIKYLTLPRHIVYNITDLSNNIFDTDMGTTGFKSTILGNYRYLILRIKELGDDKLYSTNDNIRNNCFILYRDSNYYDALNDLWIATQPVKIYYDNQLKNNLSKLTFEILTPDFQEFRLKYIDNTSLSNIDYNYINNPGANSNFYSTYTPLIQMSMEIEFGVCENQINTQKSYRT
jgi:hypothetical protein